MFIRNDQGDVRVSIEGRPFFGPWQTYAGADLTSTSGKTRPGSMGDQTDVGGPASRNDATLTIQWTEEVLAAFKTIEAMVGWGRVRVSINWLDRRTKAPFPGALFTRVGTLKGCSDPNYDTNGNVVGDLTLVVGMDEKSA